MKTVTYDSPEFSAFTRSLKRRALPESGVHELVREIISAVAKSGDLALIDFTERFDGAKLGPADLRISDAEFDAAEQAIAPATVDAIQRSLANIRDFAAHSLRQDWSTRNAEGAEVGERFTPFQRVGVYVPGGKAPLVSSALMTAGFASAAGVPEIVAATPCANDGTVNQALLYALRAAGVTQAFRIGGAQAIAALALGTGSIAPVDRIFGPGNKFVVEAKRQLVGAVSIDLLPGPSEILVLADSSADARFIAADLLAQAEHGGDSIVGLITDSAELIAAVESAIAEQAPQLARGEILADVLERGAFIVQTKTFAEAVALANDFAPEHLSLICRDEGSWLPKISTSGAIYVGNFSVVAVGDFLAGPSHTLPTGGGARSFSGLRADQFQRRTSIVRMDRAAVAASLDACAEFARVEGLDAHGRSVAIRLDRA